MNIYIGNLSQQVSEQQLEELFKGYGAVTSVKIIRDMFTGESKGFAFVEMKEKAAAETAIKELNTKEVGGKKIVVNEARPKTDSRRSGGNRGGGGSRSGGGKRW
ncbi:MAG: RNA-binding protein [Ignavibacteriales bacterium]|nr:RNA-binding protein [Ignavibacteriales bacterium]